MSEEILIQHCSPTLAGIKPASLIHLHYENHSEAEQDIRMMNVHLFTPKGLRGIPMRYETGGVLLYLYRPDYLALVLSKKEVKEYLQSLGYRWNSIAECVAELALRVQQEGDFPHEIGLFLGYPLEDVVGFTQHRGKECKCSGYWKVYGDQERASCTFEQYRSCTRRYVRSWERGVSLDSLIVEGFAALKEGHENKTNA